MTQIKLEIQLLQRLIIDMDLQAMHSNGVPSITSLPFTILVNSLMVLLYYSSEAQVDVSFILPGNG